MLPAGPLGAAALCSPATATSFNDLPPEASRPRAFAFMQQTQWNASLQLKYGMSPTFAHEWHELQSLWGLEVLCNVFPYIIIHVSGLCNSQFQPTAGAEFAKSCSHHNLLAAQNREVAELPRAYRFLKRFPIKVFLTTARNFRQIPWKLTQNLVQG